MLSKLVLLLLKPKLKFRVYKLETHFINCMFNIDIISVMSKVSLLFMLFSRQLKKSLSDEQFQACYSYNISINNMYGICMKPEGPS